jgi:hypothetical protein
VKHHRLLQWRDEFKGLWDPDEVINPNEAKPVGSFDRQRAFVFG